MPELPDVLIYLEALQRQIGGRVLEKVMLKSSFLLRTFEPELESVQRKRVIDFRRMGKRIVWELEDDLFLVFHLMITGRFHWRKVGALPRSKTDLAAFSFSHGVMMLTEAGAKKRASLHVVRGEAELVQFARRGIDPLSCTLPEFRQALLAENHTVKRSLTDPGIIDGIGNAYSDEILHAARLSPVKWTSRLSDEEFDRLHQAVRATLEMWIERLRSETGGQFPEKVTAFRKQMAAHGKFGQPCPVCETPIARIVYAERETNYCPKCQTGGKRLADRSLSRLLKDDWPREVQ